MQKAPELQLRDSRQDVEARKRWVSKPMTFVGCFVYVGPADLVVGATVPANGTANCAWHCRGYAHILMHNSGWCSCRGLLPTDDQFPSVSSSRCGRACDGEEALQPKRLCGGAFTFAAYSLES